VSAFAIASAAAAIPVTAVLRRLPRRAALIGALAGWVRWQVPPLAEDLVRCAGRCCGVWRTGPRLRCCRPR
jgi:hypothetical protein